jgi:hypothetical protein
MEIMAEIAELEAALEREAAAKARLDLIQQAQSVGMAVTLNLLLFLALLLIMLAAAAAAGRAARAAGLAAIMPGMEGQQVLVGMELQIKGAAAAAAAMVTQGEMAVLELPLLGIWIFTLLPHQQPAPLTSPFLADTASMNGLAQDQSRSNHGSLRTTRPKQHRPSRHCREQRGYER